MLTSNMLSMPAHWTNFKPMCICVHLSVHVHMAMCAVHACVLTVENIEKYLGLFIISLDLISNVAECVVCGGTLSFFFFFF